MWMAIGINLLPPFLRQAEKTIASIEAFRSWEASMKHRAEKIDLPAYFAKQLSKRALIRDKNEQI